MYTPKVEDNDVKRLEDLINSEFETIELTVEPLVNAVANDCFNVIQKEIEESGGKLIVGWQIWKSNFLIEGESHAVWESPEGVLYDFTPKANNAKTILFIEDPRIIYEGKNIDSIRLNVTNNKIVDCLIEVSKTYFIFTNRGQLAFFQGNLLDVLNIEERHELLGLWFLKSILIQMLHSGATHNSSCFCGSGNTFYNCHYRVLI